MNVFSFVILTVEIRKSSRIPGVIITQYVEKIPPGKSTPDFTRKPMAVNIMEGIQTQTTLYYTLNLFHNFTMQIEYIYIYIEGAKAQHFAC